MRLEPHAGALSQFANEPVRRHPRAMLSVPLRLRHLMGGGIHNSPGITLDVSEGGVGALVQGDLRLGETVELDLQFPDRPLSVIAIVRHTSRVRSGFEFLGMTAEERSQIASTCGQRRVGL